MAADSEADPRGPAADATRVHVEFAAKDADWLADPSCGTGTHFVVLVVDGVPWLCDGSLADLEHARRFAERVAAALGVAAIPADAGEVRDG